MLHIYYFESLLEQHGNLIGYKFSPNMIGIQEGYNKNFHIKCIEYYEKFDTWLLFWDMKMVILESC